jgi:trigger factor
MSLKSANKTEVNTYELEVTVSAEEFNEAVRKVYNKNKSRYNVPGWRKGKAPMHLVELTYGEGVFYDEAIEMLYPALVDDAVKASGIKPVDTPYDVDIKEIGKDKGVELTMKITVRPEITVSSYKGLEACRHEAEVEDAEVDAEIERLRNRNSTIKTVEDRPAKEGDTAVIDFEGFVDGEAFEGGKGEKHELILGSGHFIPGFEDQIIGHSTGDEFDVNVTFPEEYTKELAGKAAVFKVKINELKEKILPELDDEFAKDVSDVAETVEDLKKSIKDEKLKAKQDEAYAHFENELLMKLAENVEGEIPECMYKQKADENKESFARRIIRQGIDVNTYLSYLGIDSKQYDEDMHSQAVQQVKVRLALEKIAELEGIEVSAEDLEAEYAKLAENYKVAVDSVKGFFAEDDIKADIMCEKAIKVVVDNAVICEHSHDNEEESTDEKAE